MNPSHPALLAIGQLLEQRAGVRFDTLAPVLADRVLRAMRKAGTTDPARYFLLLGEKPPLFEDLLAEVAVGETWFFREPAQFAFLRETVLPGFALAEPIRAWSAGCASGEEAYSLAMLFESEGRTAARVLGTDLSAEALRRARRAAYRDWSLRGDEARFALPYLERRGDLFHVRDEIRRRVEFHQLNLAGEDYPQSGNGTSGLDVILCRNVLIYLSPATVTHIARKFFEALRPGGWLLTASADPNLGSLARFQTQVTSHGVFYQRPAEMRTAEVVGERRGVSPPVEARTTGGLTPRRSPAVPQEVPVIEAIRRLANHDTREAEARCEQACRAEPLNAELHYLRALLLLSQGKPAEAVRALRRVLYLDRSLAVAHFTHGSLLEQLGERKAAFRAYRQVRDLIARLSPDAPLPLGEGETAGALLQAAQERLEALHPREGQS